MIRKAITVGIWPAYLLLAAAVTLAWWWVLLRGAFSLLAAI